MAHSWHTQSELDTFLAHRRVTLIFTEPLFSKRIHEYLTQIVRGIRRR
jgi:hypothetical protein